jgi:hypothetical protein
MIVLDASAAIDWLLQTPAGQRIEQRIYARPDTLHTVHLLDVEFLQVLRRLVREGTLAPGRAEEAMEDLFALRITRCCSGAAAPADLAPQAEFERLRRRLRSSGRTIRGSSGHPGPADCVGSRPRRGHRGLLRVARSRPNADAPHLLSYRCPHRFPLPSILRSAHP